MSMDEMKELQQELNKLNERYIYLENKLKNSENPGIESEMQDLSLLGLIKLNDYLDKKLYKMKEAK